MSRFTGIAAGLMAGLAIALPMCAGAAQPAAIHGASTPPPHRGIPALRKSGAVPGNLVYICSAWPCQYNSVFGTYDQYGNPLFGVSPYGNVQSFGLAYGISPLGNVFDSRMTLGWESPNTYETTLGFSTSCNAGDWYLGPTDSGAALAIWHCVSGDWVKDKDIS